MLISVFIVQDVPDLLYKKTVMDSFSFSSLFIYMLLPFGTIIIKRETIFQHFHKGKTILIIFLISIILTLTIASIIIQYISIRTTLMILASSFINLFMIQSFSLGLKEELLFHIISLQFLNGHKNESNTNKSIKNFEKSLFYCSEILKKTLKLKIKNQNKLSLKYRLNILKSVDNFESKFKFLEEDKDKPFFKDKFNLQMDNEEMFKKSNLESFNCLIEKLGEVAGDIEFIRYNRFKDLTNIPIFGMKLFPFVIAVISLFVAL